MAQSYDDNADGANQDYTENNPGLANVEETHKNAETTKNYRLCLCALTQYA